MFDCDQSLDHDVNYQYDIPDDPATQIEQKMHALIDNLSRSCKALILTMSLDNTVVMFQPAPGSPYIETSIFLYGHKLKMVDKFT